MEQGYICNLSLVSGFANWISGSSTGWFCRVESKMLLSFISWLSERTMNEGIARGGCVVLQGESNTRKRKRERGVVRVVLLLVCFLYNREEKRKEMKKRKECLYLCLCVFFFFQMGLFVCL
eukprot:TRINITY_DN817_c0_g3_i2.p1 TRINITY_DN817_c0_g3~~TRINITY_DN817_c0_g3_i2.p1  ORF type:complete len:121 (+),score=8.68 TRINITY_DN817_c0_g3_i2:146-508(+)